MRKLLPVILLILGLAAGAGAGFFLKPAAEAAEDHAESETSDHGEAPAHGEESAGHGAPTAEGHGAASGDHYEPPSGPTETVRLANQFVVPLIEEGRVRAMVVVGLALDMSLGHSFSLARDEPRLRSVLLQVLFDHANIGGFDGVFTSGEALLSLRRVLRDAARAEIGSEVQDVLITELLRQEN